MSDDSASDKLFMIDDSADSSAHNKAIDNEILVYAEDPSDAITGGKVTGSGNRVFVSD